MANGQALSLLICVLTTAQASSQTPDAKRLLNAAESGQMQQVSALVGQGISPDLKDGRGNTPLHLAVSAGHQATAELLLKLGAAINPTNSSGLTPLDVARTRGHSALSSFLIARGAVSALSPGVARTVLGVRGFHPDTPFTTAEAFSKAIGRPAVMLEATNVSILVPKSREQAATIILPYLTRAYDELYKIVGVHTRYKLLVYAYPKGTPGVFGGTAGCVIRYTDENLDLAAQPEWMQYRVPHVSGYIEEMAHNFVHASGAEFGWEMVGWSLGMKVCRIVAPNPIFERQVAETQQGQDRTWAQYLAAGKTFPTYLPGNQVDRLHAYVLRKCEQQYGPKFWSDFFAEVRSMRVEFAACETRPGSSLNARYQLTVQCFDRLPGLQFQKLLEESGISTTAAVQSLKPTDPGWNRKLR